MISAPYPATRPDTAIIVSTHNAFNWKVTGHDRCSEFARNPADRAPLYNRWLVARAESPRSTPDWPQYRDTHTTPAKRGPKAKATTGISGHHGTIQGLSKKADKIIVVRRNPDLMQASPASHGGAYSKAVAV